MGLFKRSQSEAPSTVSSDDSEDESLEGFGVGFNDADFPANFDVANEPAARTLVHDPDLGFSYFPLDDSDESDTDDDSILI